MRVLITGGAGFIGSHLAETYLKNNAEVCIIDDLSTGSMENIAPLKPNKKFSYHIDTVTNKSLMAELIDMADVVIHLAAAVGVKLIVESPVKTIETNIQGTEVVLNLCAKKRKRVLIASTSEVYGKRETIPFNENDDLVIGPPDKGRWSYACSKAIDEFLALAYWKEKQVPATIVRLFNTVGPRQTGRYGMVIPSFVRQALKNKDITVYGNGLQSRCFTHVFDVISAIIKLVDNTDSIGEIYNIGNTEDITILSLAHKIKDMAKSSSEIIFIPYEEAYEAGFEDMLRRAPDLSKIKKLINYEPIHSLNEIITSVINYEKERI